jgi:hypothetical protein
MKNYPNTLLGYFKNAIAKQGKSTKYFNRDFLAVYLEEYKQSKKQGFASYPKTKETKFYNLNSTAYCVFLEAHCEYEKGMERLRATA